MFAIRTGDDEMVHGTQQPQVDATLYSRRTGRSFTTTSHHAGTWSEWAGWAAVQGATLQQGVIPRQGIWADDGDLTIVHIEYVLDKQ
jgi:hypothetical protein